MKIKMLQLLISAILLTFFMLTLATSSQSCIRSELLAAIEELEHRNHPVVSTPSNQNGSIVGCAQIEELNGTIQQGLQEIQVKLHDIVKEEIQQVQEDTTQKLQGVQQVIKEKIQGIQQVLSTILSLHYNPGFSPSHPAHSCKEIFDRNTTSPSGYYWLENSSGETVQAYCDMERTCDRVEGGWMKVISINVSNMTDSCPSGLKTLTSPKRLRAMDNNGQQWTWLFSRISSCPWSRIYIHVCVAKSLAMNKILQMPLTLTTATVLKHNNR